MLAKSAPNTYRLAVPPTWRAFDEFNVERLRRYVRRPIHLGGDSAEPSPVVGDDGALRQEHVIAEKLRFASGRGDHSCRCNRRVVMYRATPGSRWRPFAKMRSWTSSAPTA